MLKKAAYSLGILGTLVVLALRVFDAEPMLAFGISALTILGLAFTLGHATEQLGIAAGPRVGGILNATVGNIGEIIIAGFLINAGEIEVVHASITGSIIGNLLLVVGVSLLVGGLKNGVQQYGAQVTGMNAASLILATISLIVPATFAFVIGANPETGPGQADFFRVEAITVGVAGLLLITYCAHMFYYLRSPESPAAHLQEEHAEWSGRTALVVLLGSLSASSSSRSSATSPNTWWGSPSPIRTRWTSAC